MQKKPASGPFFVTTTASSVAPTVSTRQLNFIFASDRDNVFITKDLAGQIGKSESELKEIDKKIIVYNETIKANPDDADAHFNLGILYEKKMKFNDAISEYQKTINLKPHSARRSQ